MINPVPATEPITVRTATEAAWLARRYKKSLWLIFGCSALVNALILGTSVYTLVLYDSIIPSGSVQSLVAVFAILCLVFGLQFAFEQSRAEAIQSLADKFVSELGGPIHRVALARFIESGDRDSPRLAVDLQTIHGFLVGGGVAAIVDLPWAIPALVLLGMLSPLLGLVGVGGAVILALLSWRTAQLNQRASASLAELATAKVHAAEAQFRFAQVARAMGFADNLRLRAEESEIELRAVHRPLARKIAVLSLSARSFRLFLQMAILTVGALLVIRFQASGGVMIAASILIGRALAPVDMAIAQSRAMSAAIAGWQRIISALAVQNCAPPPVVKLPRPKSRLEIDNLWAAAPGRDGPVLKGVGFALSGGDSLAIVGTSAAGKSTLLKVLLGIWPASDGSIRFDSATRDQWATGALEKTIGYVPQELDLISGTVAQNISRFDPTTDPDAILEAAASAGIEEMIRGLPGGFDFEIGERGSNLSVGQRQRVAIARAIYGNPFLVVFDEANSNLDTSGEEAFGATISALRQRQAITIIVTQRASVLQKATHIGVLEQGILAPFGPRDIVLPKLAGPPVRSVRPVEFNLASGRRRR